VLPAAMAADVGSVNHFGAIRTDYLVRHRIPCKTHTFIKMMFLNVESIYIITFVYVCAV